MNTFTESLLGADVTISVMLFVNVFIYHDMGWLDGLLCLITIWVISGLVYLTKRFL